jgi:hypothetical protein
MNFNQTINRPEILTPEVTFRPAPILSPPSTIRTPNSRKQVKFADLDEEEIKIEIKA